MRQIDCDGLWTTKHCRKAKPSKSVGPRPDAAEIAVPVFGYKDQPGIDCAHRFLRRSVIADVAPHGGAQLGAVLEPENTGSDVGRI